MTVLSLEEHLRRVAGKKILRIKSVDDYLSDKPTECLDCKEEAQYESRNGQHYVHTCLEHIPDGNEVVGILF